MKRALKFSLVINGFLFITIVILFKLKEVSHGRGCAETKFNTRLLVVYKRSHFNQLNSPFQL
jgi:hypothetical protein